MAKHDCDIAIVMVSYNDLHPSCLPTLRRAMDKTDLDVRLVVVDNASPDFDAYSYISAHMPEAHVVLRNHNNGYGKASNRGAKELNPKYYFFLNHDTWVLDTDLFDKLHSHMEAHPGTGIVAPRMRGTDGRVQDTCRRFPAWFMPFVQRTGVANTKFGQSYKDSFVMQDFDHGKLRMVDWIQGSAFMISADLFHKIGGFDDRYFMYYEDVDLCRECWERGRPVYYMPEAEVFHLYGKGSAKEGSAIKNLLTNRLARAHVTSWIKYTAKWGLK